MGRNETVTRHGQRTLDVEQHDDAGFIHRGENGLVHGEGRVRVGEGRGFGTRIDQDCEVRGAEFQRIAFDTKRELEVIQQFHWVDPGFKRAMLVTEDTRLVTNHVKESSGLGSSLQLQSAFP